MIMSRINAEEIIKAVERYKRRETSQKAEAERRLPKIQGGSLKTSFERTPHFLQMSARNVFKLRTKFHDGKHSSKIHKKPEKITGILPAPGESPLLTRLSSCDTIF